MTAGRRFRSGAPLALASLVALLVLGCGSGDGRDSAVKAQPIARSGAVDTRIDVGGRKLHLVCQGAADKDGAGTVVLESGLGGTTANWANVLGALPSDVRTCAYDRAGLGESDPVPDEARTASALADDLEQLLEAAEIDPPYLFVSHSLGPWVSVLYADRHPDDVVGMILVDPRSPEISDRWLAATREVSAERPSAKEIVVALRSFISNPSTNDERLDVTRSEGEVRDVLGREDRLLGDRPLVVIAGSRTPDEWPEDVRASWVPAWKAGIRSYLAESSTARLMEVDSGHMVGDDAPDAVVEAIESVLRRP